MGLFEHVPLPSASTVGILYVLYWVGWIVYCRTLHPLAKVPGPFWASQRLHSTHGSLVRIAPNELSSSDPAVLQTLYSTSNPLPKTPWYTTFRPRGLSTQADLFTETDEAAHARYKKIVSPAYTLSSVLRNEAAIDECTDLFVQRVSGFAARKQLLDLGFTLELYAHDVIGRVLYGRAFGFLATGNDVGGFMGALAAALPLLHVVALGPMYMRAPLMMLAMCIPGTAASFRAVGGMATEAKAQTALRSNDTADQIAARHDVLSQLFRICALRGEQVGFSHCEIALESWAGLVAGADSVATALRAVLYYLMRHPTAHACAVSEVLAADTAGLLSARVQYTEAMTHLPYLGACVKEAMRLCPSFAVDLPRVVPARGMRLGEHYVPGGYWVGVNAAVVQMDRGVFGEDADVFRPERWLESGERVFGMERGMLVFGAGTRTCGGRNIALAELHKLVPEVLRRFDLRMAHERPWKIRNAGFVKQTDIIVHVVER
ncbi:pisatin demethylase [Pyrenochaeta sp. DS3sAY3a]|nr:pisatin demethylase [Pyrenochaeta sp. DS3sAY3a]